MSLRPQMMAEILRFLEQALADGHCVYLHCRAGIGRTGTVLGCYFIQCGMAPDDALNHLQQLWESNDRSKIWPQTPETDEQVEYVRSWQPISTVIPAQSLPPRRRGRESTSVGTSREVGGGGSPPSFAGMTALKLHKGRPAVALSSFSTIPLRTCATAGSLNKVRVRNCSYCSTSGTMITST